MESLHRAPRSELPSQTKARLAAAAQPLLHPRSRIRQRINAFGRHYGYAPPEALHQRESLRDAGCATIGDDLPAIIEKLRSGDVLVIPRLRVLANSIGDLRSVVLKVTEKGATIRATEQPFEADSGFMALLDVFSEFEPLTTSPLPPKRPKGRPRTVEDAKILAFKDQGHTVASIAEHMGISKSAIYGCLAKAKK